MNKTEYFTLAISIIALSLSLTALFINLETNEIPSTYHLVSNFRLLPNTNAILLINNGSILIYHITNGVIVADRDIYVKIISSEGKIGTFAMIKDDRLGLGTNSYMDVEIFA